MCGIAGFLRATRFDEREASATLIDMCEAIRHRGPDASGIWLDAEAGVALGHRRLSIIDLSENGAQPMASRSGRWQIVYNGEIYNFKALRRDFEAEAGAWPWRGHSDTEVLAEIIDRWGIEATLARLNGMFAVAAWDREHRELSIARDRFGEKPLYYGWMQKSFLFGSELKALLRHPDFSAAIDQEALASYLRYSNVPHPKTIYTGILKLPPGCWLTLRAKDPPGTIQPPQAFWSVEAAIERAQRQPFRGSEEEAVETADRLLSDAVELRMVADVPLGALLSGGVDSSTIVALMQKQSMLKVRTFSIGSTERGYDEAAHAKLVAVHLGTDHTDLHVDPKQALAVVPTLAHLYDEPFADSSQVPTYLVAKLARGDVTVALSGDAGDELFAGYNRHFHGAEIWRRVEQLPFAARRILAGGLAFLSPEVWNCVAKSLFFLTPKELRARAGEKIHKLAEILRAPDESHFYEGLLSHWTDPQELLQSGASGISLFWQHGARGSLTNLSERMMYLDTCSYLTDDILTKVDRASMGVSLEMRVPFLDPRVFEFAWSMPLSMKIRDGHGKHLLRRVLDRYVPRTLIDRPKQGFAIPVCQWLRKELRPWGEALLDPGRLAADGFFAPGFVRRCWEEHQSGRRDNASRLWVVLMFQAWLDGQRAVFDGSKHRLLP